MNWRTKDQLNLVMVHLEDTLIDSLPKMNQSALQVLLVVDKNDKIVGIITDGDIRRALLNGLNLGVELKHIMNRNPTTLSVDTSIAQVKDLMQRLSISHVPLVDDDGRVEDLIIWSDCFRPVRDSFNCKVVIMAGGKGTRLDPFTKILPKPMIPLGDKPIIETIMDKFYQQGFSSFILCLGYKADIIKMYFSELNNWPYQIEFVCEEEPLGTAGALSLLKGKLSDTFLVTNCDVILEANFPSLIKYHKEKDNLLTLIGAVKEFPIPYGVLKTDGQELESITEKPNLHYLVNTGLYALEADLVELLSPGEELHMTDLIIRIKEGGGKVGVYPYHGKWFDIGHWEEYRNTLKYFGSLE